MRDKHVLPYGTDNDAVVSFTPHLQDLRRARQLEAPPGILIATHTLGSLRRLRKMECCRLDRLMCPI